MPYHTYKGNEVYYGKPGEMALPQNKLNADMTIEEPPQKKDVFLSHEIFKPYVWDENLTFNDTNYSSGPKKIQDSMNIFF